MTGVPTRLIKFLGDAGIGSRSQSKAVYEANRVTVNGDGDYGLFRLVDPRSDVITVDGQRVIARPPTAYFMLNKPMGLITSMRDPHGRAVVSDIFTDDIGPAATPVGRLDKATTGLLLITDDGDLAQLLLLPEFKVWKVYRLTLKPTDITADDLARLASGLMIGSKMTMPARPTMVSRDPLVVDIAVREGRKHLIRKMAKHMRWKLIHLHRYAFGDLALGDLAPGAVRRLTPDEVERLYNDAGGRNIVHDRTVAALRFRLDEGRLDPREAEMVEAFLAD